MHRRAFTLIELLVVIAIIAVLIALQFGPDAAVQAARTRSKRSTTRTRCLPKVAISAFAVGRPNSLNSRRQSHSLSTEVEKSALRPPTSPIGSLKMCVVGVAPRGLTAAGLRR